MTYYYNKNFGLFKFQSGNRKFHLNSPKGYSRKIISAQTDESYKMIKNKMSKNGCIDVLLKCKLYNMSPH